MSQPFTFPPPPPPPPKRLPAPTSTSSQFSQTYRGGSRGRGGPRNNDNWQGEGQRGRGRGRGFVAGGYSGHAQSSNAYNSHRDAHGQKPYAASASPQNGSLTTAFPKRTYTSAFPTNESARISRPKAPPAVPSFDIDIANLLPKKPEANPVLVSEIAVIRKGNLLGLTPLKDASDSESGDEDDEVKLANALPGDTISFEHRGQKLSVNTPEEIAAWIAERRLKFPTLVKADAAKKVAEEKKQQWEERKKANQEAADLRRKEREKERDEREKQKLKEKLIAAQIQKSKAAVAEAKQDPAEKALLKAEKLRKKAEKAAQQVREAEAALARAQERRRHLTQATVEDVPALTPKEDSSTTLDVLANDADTGLLHGHSGISDTDQSSALEETSSSGTSDSEDDSNSDSAPEEFTSKRDSPERVPPPKRTTDDKTLSMCRQMQKFGKCKFGKKCRYSHDVPSKKERRAKTTQSKIQVPRKGLYQVMLEKEQEEERNRALRAIIALGEQGLLKDE